MVGYAYDASGNLAALTPPGRPAHAFTYTPVNLMSAYIPPGVVPGTAPTAYTYNADRQLTRVTRADGQTIELGYDAAGRLSGLTIARGTVGYTYAPTTGSLATINAPGSMTLGYTYDGLLPTGTTWTGAISGSVSQDFDRNFHVTSVSVNGSNSIVLEYDNGGRLVHAGDLSLSRASGNGLVTSVVLGDVTDVRAYNRFAELVGYSASYSGGALYSVQLTRDRIGRIATRAETIGGATTIRTYAYDPAGNLSEVRTDGIVASTYTYDSNGNRLTGPNGATTYAYDDQDRLTQSWTSGSPSPTVYTYTADGELLQKASGDQTTSYEYDQLGNLMAVTQPDGTAIQYLVDGRNRRVGKKANGALVQGFLYQDGLKPIAELDGSSSVISRFVYATRDNVPDYMIRDGWKYRILSDDLGSPRLVIDPLGVVVQRLEYDSFGRVLADTNPGFQPFGFAGGLYDSDTSFVRFGARDYDANIGRWVAKDPVLPVGANTNSYRYASNDPINRRDPGGLDDRGSTNAKLEAQLQRCLVNCVNQYRVCLSFAIACGDAKSGLMAIGLSECGNQLGVCDSDCVYAWLRGYREWFREDEDPGRLAERR